MWICIWEQKQEMEMRICMEWTFPLAVLTAIFKFGHEGNYVFNGTCAKFSLFDKKKKIVRSNPNRNKNQRTYCCNLGSLTVNRRRFAMETRNNREKEEIKKGPWTAEEDEILINFVKENGPKEWSSIRTKGLLPRTGKSCRLRWVNKLQPNLKKYN